MKREVSAKFGTLAVCVLLMSSLTAVFVRDSSSSAGADTDPTTLAGQGGSFFEPVMSKLLTDDSANLNPLFGAYLQTDDNSGIAAFVGSSPGSFSADFAITQRPLTASEASTAQANGRSFVYIPIAATPVALVTLVPTRDWGNSGSTSITAAGFCQHLPLTTELLGQIYGFDAASPLHSWGDPRITCPEPGGGSSADPLPILAPANLDPSMSNFATMVLLNSTPQSLADLQAALGQSGSLTTDSTPSELWPFAGQTVPGGDEPLIGKLLALNSQTNAPGPLAGNWQLGAISPLSSVWTGSPLGVAWDLPTAAVQNAQGAEVAPSLGAAEAAAADSTMAVTSDATSNNLVTFNANTSDATAYNNYLMEESYLLVPTNGLSAAKASALAQIIRFMLGTQGQKDIEGFGSAPATSAEQSAGLKVAAGLSVEAAVSPNPPLSSTATQSPSTAASASASKSASGTATAGTATAASSSGSTSNPGSGGSSAAADSSGGLAFTGTSHLGDWVGLGVVLFAVGSFVRFRLRRRRSHS